MEIHIQIGELSRSNCGQETRPFDIQKTSFKNEKKKEEKEILDTGSRV